MIKEKSITVGEVLKAMIQQGQVKFSILGDLYMYFSLDRELDSLNKAEAEVLKAKIKYYEPVNN